ncbi:hypothetical protein [Fulvivirga lutea]|uniref:Uncharacterized protein n=1 Tax=Fulvivirga lutea TaxID=2810512 RepID=A0A974WL34_9BACT|nr:hypothetical protein [Fulvivirga lutea]QSE98180.1 hypothetical protein JR347_03620 [Fulvivirga lutea]
MKQILLITLALSLTNCSSDDEEVIIQEESGLTVSVDDKEIIYVDNVIAGLRNSTITDGNVLFINANNENGEAFELQIHNWLHNGATENAILNGRYYFTLENSELNGNCIDDPSYFEPKCRFGLGGIVQTPYFISASLGKMGYLDILMDTINRTVTYDLNAEAGFQERPGSDTTIVKLRSIYELSYIIDK